MNSHKKKSKHKDFTHQGVTASETPELVKALEIFTMTIHENSNKKP